MLKNCTTTGCSRTTAMDRPNKILQKERERPEIILLKPKVKIGSYFLMAQVFHSGYFPGNAWFCTYDAIITTSQMMHDYRSQLFFFFL